ncbi:hypothetical protein [Nocardia nova]|uniref:hypothetical protein n=1 Tax=Nocardia nova TaxID=37330 RepID=UPI0015E277B4|nr:hypothetical protein [Nocardia nova]
MVGNGKVEGPSMRWLAPFIPAETDTRAVLVAATAPLYHQLVLVRTSADPDGPRRAATAAVLAAQAGAFAAG